MFVLAGNKIDLAEKYQIKDNETKIFAIFQYICCSKGIDIGEIFKIIGYKILEDDNKNLLKNNKKIELNFQENNKNKNEIC